MSERGQIEPMHEFGMGLTRLAKDSETICEIGSFFGEGSTVCLANGLVRPTQKMYVIECSPKMWLEASRFHKDHRIRFICEEAKNAIVELPPVIDLMLFDGGDLTTDQEFDLLYSRCGKYIALDDINERKNRRQFAALKALRPLIKECHHDRNGWALFGPPVYQL